MGRKNIKAKKQRFFLVNLGCPKNLVDSERISLELLKRGGTPVSSPEDADVILVNTCGFISDARRMSEEHIRELAKFRKEGKELVVLGCYPERIGIERARKTLPADFVFGAGGDTFIESLNSVLPYSFGRKRSSEKKRYDDVRRLNTLSPFSAYVKLSEGCSRGCTFCSIPKIRGFLRSRDEEEIIDEVKYLADTGVREFILISQDTTMWGRDKPGGRREDLFRLLDRISEIDGVEWIRLFYIYPDTFVEKLIDYISGNPKIVRYIEIPFQHIDDEILRKMGRATTEKLIRRIMDKIREKIPDMSLRTELIVGFPGEDTRKFHKLLSFVEEYRFDWLGVFTYSPEPGTPSYKMWKDELGIGTYSAGSTDDGSEWESIQGVLWEDDSNGMNTTVKKFFEDAEKKRKELMELWTHIFAEKQRGRVGEVFRCISEGGGVFRTYFQAPEVDGVVILTSQDRDVQSDSPFCELEIIGFDGADLLAREACM